MSTTQKHREFVGEPMGDKPVTAIAGIGLVLGEKLAKEGFGLAKTLYGQFLVLQQNQEKFTKWLKETAGANHKQATDCFNCLMKYAESHL